MRRRHVRRFINTGAVCRMLKQAVRQGRAARTPLAACFSILLGLEDTTFYFLQVDKVWRLYASLFPEFYQLRGFEEATGILQRGPL